MKTIKPEQLTRGDIFKYCYWTLKFLDKKPNELYSDETNYWCEIIKSSFQPEVGTIDKFGLYKEPLIPISLKVSRDFQEDLETLLNETD